MFCIITDGDYSIIKYVFIEIIQQIFLKKLDNNDKIKDFVDKCIDLYLLYIKQKI